MPYDFTTMGNQSNVATELVVSIYDQVDQAFNDVLYPEILWKTVVPAESIRTDINPGAQNLVYRSRDVKGMGQFINGDTRNIPRVAQTTGQVTVPILDGAVGSELTNAEARRYQFGYQSALAQDFAEIMKLAAERHVERLVFFGDNNAGFASFLNYPGISIIASDPWVGTNVDPETWVAAINSAITSVWTLSKLIHLPNEALLPPSLYALMTAAYVIGSGSVGVAVSAIEYLKKNNIYTLTTGNELNVKPLRYLESAGVGGLDRAIVRENLGRNMVFPFPLAYQLAQPVPVALGVEMYAEYVVGSINFKYPKSMAYIDIAAEESSS